MISSLARGSDIPVSPHGQRVRDRHVRDRHVRDRHVRGRHVQHERSAGDLVSAGNRLT